jgi:hypothetical protein
MYTIQDRYYVTLIICNQLKLITCIKSRVFFYLKIISMYLENLNLLNKGQHPNLGPNAKKINGQSFNLILMVITIKYGTFGLKP